MWPVIGGVAAAGLVLAGSFVYPLVVEPVFNQFQSLEHGALRSGVLSLAEREGDIDALQVVLTGTGDHQLAAAVARAPDSSASGVE